MQCGHAGVPDFNEAQVKAMLDRSPVGKMLHRWVEVGNNLCGIRMNWISFLLATILTWGFMIITFSEPTWAKAEFGKGKAWVSANFTWFYIGTQDVWCAFLIYIFFSRFGKIKLGKDDEKPKYNDFVWFSMLFTCGVAVGLYVFGVAEPLYFYRQPTSWMWGSSYAMTKTTIENDAQRAQQAIFQTVYHWGIHGWVPYILLALTLGITSFRWGMPITIRSCFYPLFGDNSLGLFGDIVDGLSCATTTFGVCTSLGLGVTQLAGGLKFLQNIGCNAKSNCQAAGGCWRLDTTGKDTCYQIADAQCANTSHFVTEDPLTGWDTCPAGFLASAENKLSAYYVIIVCITILATFSVLSGIDRGIKSFAAMAFTCGVIVLIICLLSDNTWYLLNVMVQSTGYYLQWVMQVGFDCEAFQQLNFELTGPNYYWGSQGDQSMLGVLQSAGLVDSSSNFIDGISLTQAANLDDIGIKGANCGNMLNPCKNGIIPMGANSADARIPIQNMFVAATFMSPGIEYLRAKGFTAQSYQIYKDRLDDLANWGATSLVYWMPCGTGFSNKTNADKTWASMTGIPEQTPWCEKDMRSIDGNSRISPTRTVEQVAACERFFNGPFPRCPSTTYTETSEWGRCFEHTITSCPVTVTMYDSTNPNFMDWWTIFYWAWWITWAPFVGFFVAIISRGRTVREVIFGGFFCPTVYAIIWFSVFGGLAIKMERTAEIGLQTTPDYQHTAVTCAEHYSGGTPITPAAKKLADQGYYMLTCMPKDDQIYRLMEPYENRTEFLHFFLWIGLVIYFLTSSDSGSMTDDIITASGLSAELIPPWQKVFWCWTEGGVALALVNAGGALKSLQHVSIIIGLPYTFFLCMFVPSLYRCLKREMGDADIINSRRFSTQLLDVLELFKPRGGSPCPPATHLKHIFVALLFPFLSIKNVYDNVRPGQTVTVLVLAVLGELLWIAWIICEGLEAAYEGFYVLGWLFYLFLLAIIIHARIEMRAKYNVWGNWSDDFFATLFAWPFVLAQLQMEVEVNPDGNNPGPTYFATVDEMSQELASLASTGESTTADPVINKA